MKRRIRSCCYTRLPYKLLIISIYLFYFSCENKKIEFEILNPVIDIGKLHISDNASGMVDWYPKGYELYRRVESYIRAMQENYGYREVRSPVLANDALWRNSGHSEKYNDNMFHLSHNNLSVKPMSCPFHINIFNPASSSCNKF